jgi:hypothetical protein
MIKITMMSTSVRKPTTEAFRDNIDRRVRTKEHPSHLSPGAKKNHTRSSPKNQGQEYIATTQFSLQLLSKYEHVYATVYMPCTILSCLHSDLRIAVPIITRLLDEEFQFSRRHVKFIFIQNKFLEPNFIITL